MCIFFPVNFLCIFVLEIVVIIMSMAPVVLESTHTVKIDLEIMMGTRRGEGLTGEKICVINRRGYMV